MITLDDSHNRPEPRPPALAPAFRVRGHHGRLVAVDVVLVAIARMAPGAHYATDVLAGLLGGLAALGFYARFTQRGAWADKPPAGSPPGDSRDAHKAHA